MRQVTWTVDGYTVTSWGNGFAYTITAPDSRDVFLQGDDALTWREEYDQVDASSTSVASFLRETIADYT